MSESKQSRRGVHGMCIDTLHACHGVWRCGRYIVWDVIVVFVVMWMCGGSESEREWGGWNISHRAFDG